MNASSTLEPSQVAGHKGRISLLHAGAIVFVAQSAVNLLNFVFHFFVSRRVGVVAYGSLNALIAGFTLLTTPAIILTTVVVKYASEFFSAGDSERLRALLQTCSRIFGIAALLLVVTGFALARNAADYLHIGATLPVILTIGILAGNLILPVRGILQGAENFRGYAFSITSEAALKVCLAVVLTALGFGINGALMAWLVGVAVSVFYTYLILSRQFKAYTTSPLRFDYRQMVKTIGCVTLATLLVSSLGFSDVILVKHFFDARSAGLYSAAALCGKMIFMLVSFLPAVILPKAANLKNSGRATGSVLIQGMAASIFLVAAALAVYWLFPSHVIGALAGQAFQSAAPYVFAYGIASALLSILNTVVYYRIGAHTFSFLPILFVIAVCQIALISIFHATISGVIEILIGCDAAALVCVLYRVNRKIMLPETACAA